MAQADESASALFLARHGETDDNREPIKVQGFTDTPLNDTGRRQAHELAERVATLGFVSLWSSDLKRARATADIIGNRIALSVRPDPRLREADRGEWEGRRSTRSAGDDRNAGCARIAAMTAFVRIAAHGFTEYVRADYYGHSP